MKQNFTIHGLRGLCALMVFIVHAIGMAINSELMVINETIWHNLDHLAGLGVNLFFAISGYLILHSLIKQNNLSRFLKNRFYKIYPVYLVLLFIMFAIGPILNFEWFANISVGEYIFYFFTNLFLLHGMTDFPQAVANSWTLTFEFVFYFMSCYFFFAVSRVKSNKVLRTVLVVFGILITVFLLFTFPRAWFFLAGSAIYFLEQNKNKFISYEFKYGSSLILFLSTWLTMNISIYLSLLFGFLFFISMVNQTGVTSKILNTKIFQYLGTISYSFYLWHPFGIFGVKTVMGIIGVSNIIVFIVLGTIASLILSHFSYKLIEVILTDVIKGKRTLKSSFKRKEAVM